MDNKNKDWKIEQLREVERTFRTAQGKRVYLNGEPCIIHHLMLVQPAFIANHPGKALEIDVIDTHGNKHEIRLYTSEWPEERR
jgi:hypothetical protein